MVGTLNSLVVLRVVSAWPSVHNGILAVASSCQCPKLDAAFGSGSSYFLLPSVTDGHMLYGYYNMLPANQAREP